MKGPYLYPYLYRLPRVRIWTQSAVRADEAFSIWGDNLRLVYTYRTELIYLLLAVA